MKNLIFWRKSKNLPNHSQAKESAEFISLIYYYDPYSSEMMTSIRNPLSCLPENTHRFDNDKDYLLKNQ